MIVCVCNRLNENRIRAAIAGGADPPLAAYAGCGVKRKPMPRNHRRNPGTAKAKDRLDRAA